MKTIKLSEFSFKREPIWMWLFSLVPAIVGIMIALLVVLIRKFVV